MKKKEKKEEEVKEGRDGDDISSTAVARVERKSCLELRARPRLSIRCCRETQRERERNVYIGTLLSLLLEKNALLFFSLSNIYTLHSGYITGV